MNDFEDDLKVDQGVDSVAPAHADPVGLDSAYLQRAPHIPAVKASQQHDMFNVWEDDEPAREALHESVSSLQSRAPLIEEEPAVNADEPAREALDESVSSLQSRAPLIEEEPAVNAEAMQAPELDEGELVDHPDAERSRLWKERKKAMGFERSKAGKFKSALTNAVAGTGNVITKIGAAGAQDSYTAGKTLGGIGAAVKGAVDTTKDLAKIGKGVDFALGRHGENSILNNNIGVPGWSPGQIPGVTYKDIAESQFAPGIKAPETIKAAVTDGGTLLQIAGRGITAASGRRALDVGDAQRQKYIERRDAFTSKRAEMRERLAGGERSNLGSYNGAAKAGVEQTMAALELGRAVSNGGIRPEYEYSMKESADINNLKVKRTAKPRSTANPSFDPDNPESQSEMQIKPGEVTYERNAGTDPLNAEPDYQTKQELTAGRRAKALAAPGEALEGLGRIVDGSEHGQEAVRKGEYLKGGTQAALSGARTIGKGALGAVAAPLGLGMATSAVVDAGTNVAGGLLQAVGGGINSVTGVGKKADKQRALELRNDHYFGQKNFLKSDPLPAANAPAAELEEQGGEPVEEEKLPDGAGDAQPQLAASGAERQGADVPKDQFFDTARGRRIAERGLRARDPLKAGDYEKGDRDAGLPQVDHGGVFKNFWHNRMKRPMQKMGQGLVKPLAMVAKGLGYIPLKLYKSFQAKKRQKAIDAAINRTNNRRGGQLNQDDFELVDHAAGDDFEQVDHPDAQRAASAPSWAGDEDQDKTLRSLEQKQADSQINRVELRQILNAQNKSYTSSTKSRGAEAALKMDGRDLTKENITAWRNFERKHNEERLAQMIADRKRERTKNPITGESFLEKQKREYREWYDKKKRFDYADADMGAAMQRFAATDPHGPKPPAPSEAAGMDIGQAVDLEKEEDNPLDGGSSRGSMQLSDDGSQALDAAMEKLSNRKRIGGQAARAAASLAVRPRDLEESIPEADPEQEEEAEEEAEEQKVEQALPSAPSPIDATTASEENLRLALERIARYRQ